MEGLRTAYGCLMVGILIILVVLIIISMIRSVAGPRIADRIIAVNMIGTMVIMMIAVLSVYLEENYLVDVCLIYAMISFLGVVVLCKVYTGVYLQRKQMKADLGAVEDNVRRQRLEKTGGRPGQEEPATGYVRENCEERQKTGVMKRALEEQESIGEGRQ